MKLLHSLDDIVAAVRLRGRRPRVAIAPCAEEFILQAALAAAERRVAKPVFIGDAAKTKGLAAEAGLDLADYELLHEPDDTAAVHLAVSLFREGRADLLMKGLVSTSVVLKAVLDKETGVPPESGILSHLAAFNAPTGRRLMLLTDAGVNIRPNLQRKADILRNALDVARRLGMDRPKAAVLAAVEKVNFPAMPATLDADLLAKMGQAGEFGTSQVAGPLSLDLAISPEIAATKGVSNPVAGRADILLVPDIESGNILYKALTTLTGLTLAGVVVGSRVPVVVPSRGDSNLSKFHSIALAAYLAGSPA